MKPLFILALLPLIGCATADGDAHTGAPISPSCEQEVAAFGDWLVGLQRDPSATPEPEASPRWEAFYASWSGEDQSLVAFYREVAVACPRRDEILVAVAHSAAEDKMTHFVQGLPPIAASCDCALELDDVRSWAWEISQRFDPQQSR